MKKKVKLTIPLILVVCLATSFFEGCVADNDGLDVLNKEGLMGCWETKYGPFDSAYSATWNVFEDSVVWFAEWKISPEKSGNGKFKGETELIHFQDWRLTKDTLYFDQGIGYLLKKENGVSIDSITFNFSSWKSGYQYRDGKIRFPKTTMERCGK